MRPTWILVFLLVPLAACGGKSTSDTPETGGSAGTGASAASGGSGAHAGTGGTSGGGSGGVGGTIVTGGTGGMGGTGAWPACCAQDSDCPGGECVNTACVTYPPDGACYRDADCVAGAVCSGAAVCGCAADCSYDVILGKCVLPPGCCANDADCGSDPSIECVTGNCVKKPPPMQCWSDQDCPVGLPCSGACNCPCGTDCLCGGTTGWCEGQPPPPPATCCQKASDCGPFAECVGDVCEIPVQGGCWLDADCMPGQTCAGASACPCGASCLVADHPGTCQ
jgi:hypothetical protein